MDWFLYDSDLRHERVNSKLVFTLTLKSMCCNIFVTLKTMMTSKELLLAFPPHVLCDI